MQLPQLCVARRHSFNAPQHETVLTSLRSLQKVAALAQECYRRAIEARRIAPTAVDSAEKKDLLEVEQRWLSLARSMDPEDECKRWLMTTKKSGG